MWSLPAPPPARDLCYPSGHLCHLPPASIDIPAGPGVVLIVGPSGAGKTRLLHSMCSKRAGKTFLLGGAVVDGSFVQLGLDHLESGEATAIASSFPSGAVACVEFKLSRHRYDIV